LSYPAKPLVEKNLDELYQAILRLPDYNLMPNTDNYSEANLMVDDTGRIWFAECAIESANPTPEGIDNYYAVLAKNIEYLRKVYVQV
jgi:hypothetical protein